jgi:hypothetical protein
MKKWTTYAGHCKHGRVQMVGRHIGKQKQVEFNGFLHRGKKESLLYNLETYVVVIYLG